MEWNVNNAFKSSKDVDPKSVMDLPMVPHTDPVDNGLPSSEKWNALSTAKPRKKTMTSVYLKFFETAPDGKSRRCKFCGQTYSIATATGNLGRHLSSRHPGYEKSGDSVKTAALQLSSTMIRKHQTEAKPPKVDVDYLNWMLVKWLTQASLPPGTLEEKWLVNSFKFLNPSIQIWPAEKFQVVLYEVCRTMQQDVRMTVDQVSSKVAIALEFWTSYEEIYYMSITCQWIDDNWSFQKVLLDICRIPYPCGGAEIYHCLVKVLKMYNIDNKVLTCTHDNSQSAIHACHKLKEDMDSHKLGPFCYIPCAVRTLNMVIEDGLRTTKPVISKVREFVIEMNASSEMSEDFTQFTTAYQEGSWTFPLDVSARWSGHYQMLDIICKAGKSVDSLIRKYEEILGSRILLNSSEKNAINILHDYLEPFYKTTNNICAEKVPTVGLVLFFMDHIFEMIAACKDSRHYPDWLKSAAEDMAKKAQNYNNQVCNVFTYMTAVLDPRIKSELIPENLNSQDNLEEARAHFIRNYSTGHFSSINGVYGTQENGDGGSVSFAEEIARKKRRASMSSATDVLTQYLSEPPAPISTDVLEWWKVNSTRYPRLSIMARDFLAVQATSVAPEELFCSKGAEIVKQRFCMPSHSTQAGFCVKSWIESGFRLRHKSTEIDYDRLMELVAENSASNVDKKQK
ncbi:hypothetical protein Nepgr_018928 [Nepenthes gracilis]|uniref:Transposase n=1 Tax=Nepenthes gracilis TaxID=150966 RepID=A0AAD3SUY8_NEPGR|nr:hypothetical protein Nepgr_018928 [Nepenthes gracilis]